MQTFYLRFDNRAELLTALDAAGWMDEGKIARPADMRLDEIGPITTTPAVYDEAGEEVSPATIDGRHHVNVYSLDGNPLPAALSAYAIAAPATPLRVFGVAS